MDRWRLNLTRPGSVFEDHDLDEAATVDAAKAWAEPLIHKFMEGDR